MKRTDQMMSAAVLHGPRDMRIEQHPHPGPPGAGEVLLRLTAVGICGSDLHSYLHGSIGDTRLDEPLIPGHEFAGTVETVGPHARDGTDQPLEAGTRVAVDPAQPCERCDLCRQGHPNLCRRLIFVGLTPHHGAMCKWMRVPARVCHPLPDNIDDAIGALLETLGVALHATDLAHIRAGASVAILGAGPIGLCITRVVAASGARDLFVADPLPWRRDVARRSAQSVTAIDNQRGEAVERIMELTGGRGVDVAIEAAWSDQSVQQAAEMLRPGGRLVIVGIPAEDRFSMIHSTARRKGLTIAFCRRMKHTYPRAIHLVNSGLVQLDDLITHRFPLQQAADGFELAGRYEPGLVKAILEI